MMVFDTYGSDAMRWYLLSSPILRGSDLAVTEDGIRDTVRQVLLPIWNTWYFLALYANAEGTQGTVSTQVTPSTDVLDRYILAKTHDLVVDVTAQLDDYDLFAACGSVRTFLDALTNWYVRRSRDRFWSGDQEAIDTLHTVLSVLCRVAAPLLPLTTEAVYRGLTGERSVHLDRLARRCRSARRSRAGGHHGPGPRRVLGDAAGAQGAPAAGAAAARVADRGGARAPSGWPTSSA